MHHIKHIAGSGIDKIEIKRALISVFDKSGVVELAQALRGAGVQILSTGGTAKLLSDSEIETMDVGSYTGFPEILDGRVKTLHPKVHGGLLAVRGNEKHDQECSSNDIEPIDLLVMNLYPFESTGADFHTCVENIDIGGPAMLRSSAKNHAYVTVLTSPDQYATFLAGWQTVPAAAEVPRPFTLLRDRQAYALKAFQLSAHYDARITEYLAEQVEEQRKVRPMSLMADAEGGPVPAEHPHTATQDYVLLPPSTVLQQPQSGVKEEAGEEAEKAGKGEDEREVSGESSLKATAVNDQVSRSYRCELQLKYGVNPHQAPAAVYSIVSDAVSPAAPAPTGTGREIKVEGKCTGSVTDDTSTVLSTHRLPFTVLHGTPGYINLLDALYGWQLVREASQVLGGVAVAASYKHCSPAGAAVGSVKLSLAESLAYEVDDADLSDTARAYLRARNADPLCSFGDFAALSHPVDLSTAKLLKPLVCDGVIAPGFEPEALEILKAKKKGAFIVLQVDPHFEPPVEEFRELFGVAFSQRRADRPFTEEQLNNVVVIGSGLQEGTTGAGPVSAQMLPESARRDLILASIAIKYTQSNSVAYARNGQVIGVGAGQQSRVDCVKLAGRKAATWYLRQHPKVQSLPFKSSVRKQDRINARVRYIEGDITAAEMPFWLECFEAQPAPLTREDKAAFMNKLDGVALSSDAFFPFRDSIDHASKYGVSYVAQPGGSIADDEVKGACAEYGMTMVFTDLRLFLH